MALLSYVFNMVMQLYIFVLLVAVVMSWLIAFNVVNTHNQAVAAVQQITHALTDPLLRHIRRYVPPVGGLDLSFVVLIIGVYAFQFAVNTYIFLPLLKAGIP